MVEVQPTSIAKKVPTISARVQTGNTPPMSFRPTVASQTAVGFTSVHWSKSCIEGNDHSTVPMTMNVMHLRHYLPKSEVMFTCR